MKNWLKLIFVLILVALVYRNSFTARFFQDDKLNLELAASKNFLAVIPGANHYRPVSVQGFYLLGETVSGYNPMGYHLLEFGLFAATLFLVYKSGLIVTGNARSAFLISFLYALNISLFANFYWIANSQFVIGSFLFFLSFVLFYSKGWKQWLAVPVFLIGLLSNEQIISLVVLLPIVSRLLKKPYKFPVLASLAALALGWVGLRLFVLRLPTTSDYALNFRPLTLLATLRWYILRALDLPEGIKLRQNLQITVLFIIFLGSLLPGLRKLNWKLITLGGLWYLVALGVFAFMPGHISAHYLTVSLFGSSLILAQFLPKNKLMLAGILTVYLGLTVYGLEFLSRTHWIILKNTGPIGQF